MKNRSTLGFRMPDIISYILKVRAASVLRKANDEAAAKQRSSEVSVGGDSSNGGGSGSSSRSPEVMALERMVEALNTKIGDLGSVSQCSVTIFFGSLRESYSVQRQSHATSNTQFCSSECVLTILQHSAVCLCAGAAPPAGGPRPTHDETLGASTGDGRKGPY